jgi:predicted Zn-dependent peptidase
MKGNLILGLESSNNRMQNIARQEIYYGQYYSPEEIIREIEAVSLEQARDLSERLVQSGAMALTVLGPVERSTVSELPL